MFKSMFSLYFYYLNYTINASPPLMLLLLLNYWKIDSKVPSLMKKYVYVAEKKKSPNLINF